MEQYRRKSVTLENALRLALSMLGDREFQIFRVVAREITSKQIGWENANALLRRKLGDPHFRTAGWPHGPRSDEGGACITVQVRLSASIAKALGDTLEAVGIDRGEVATVVRDNAVEAVEGIGYDEAFVAESYVYPSRRAAARGASLLHAKYWGSDGHTLRFRKGGRVVAQWFPNRKRKARI